MKFNWIEKQDVIVVDDLMGSGKTTWAIQMINQAPQEHKFIFISVYLTEIERVKKACKHTRTFHAPSTNNKDGRKLTSLKQLLDNGHDIATTHALFKDFDDEVLTLLKLHHYTLVMDEVTDVVEKLEISLADIKLLQQSKLIEVDEQSKVTWLDDDYNGKFDQLKKVIQTEKVFLHNETAFIWTFPVEVFEVFRRVFILTYLFEGQVQRYYFDLHKVPYTMKSVGVKDQHGQLSMTIKNGEFSHRVIPHYELIEWRKPDVSHLKELIQIVDDDKLNSIGEPVNTVGHDALTFTKMEKLSKSSPMTKRIQNNMVTFFRYRCNATVNDVMWTAPKKVHDKRLIGQRFTGGFVSSNARATNEFRHKTVCAYMLNKFMNPSIVGFFESQGIEVDQDVYALSELVQWVFRSAVRDNKPIQLYIPSRRMRTLLVNWLNS